MAGAGSPTCSGPGYLGSVLLNTLVGANGSRAGRGQHTSRLVLLGAVGTLAQGMGTPKSSSPVGRLCGCHAACVCCCVATWGYMWRKRLPALEVDGAGVLCRVRLSESWGCGSGSVPEQQSEAPCQGHIHNIVPWWSDSVSQAGPQWVAWELGLKGLKGWVQAEKGRRGLNQHCRHSLPSWLQVPTCPCPAGSP
jgi:hypothetical protein